ncbi:Golgi phosphoprotein 3 GPP34 [Krasilnikovia cinnamomea]|uniref:Golgi phosphoprotein 3 GPP34 n=1 Tax=Krasilnikovia cinnamomea TaxID=349313 RepID=A0A4Q7ZJZ7_9ACTN|nr:GPP34 family phosphoprotein [Krasilnikovia cinnamomea]RZU51227.1 Golgi phosphoprotein 3 GPP34 [Krasilnikovia cinnamomea]
MQRLPLRAELYLLAHDEDRTDLRPWTNLPALGIALVGACLIDLVITGWIDVADDHVSPRTASNQWTGDYASDLVLHTVRVPPPGPTVADVLHRHSPDMYQQTTNLLLHSGILRRTRRRLRGSRYQLVEPMVVPRARGAPRQAVEYPERSDLHTDALCALIRSTGLESILYLSLPASQLRARLDAITNGIRTRFGDPRLHAIPDITAAVDTAIGALSVAVYR